MNGQLFREFMVTVRVVRANTTVRLKCYRGGADTIGGTDHMPFAAFGQTLCI